MSLDGEISISVDVVSGVSQHSVLGPLLFVLYTFELFHIVGNHMVGYADDTTIYAVILRLLSRPQVMQSLNRDLVAIYSWCLLWHMRLNPKNTKPTIVSRSQTDAPGYSDLTLGGAELKVIKRMGILGVTFDV